MTGVGIAALTVPRWLVAADIPLSLPAGEKPNIIYVIADDLGYGDVQCLNPEHGKIKTPNADRLASRGITFMDAHGGSSLCSPTRYGILTGRYAWRSRLQYGVLSGAKEPALIAANRLTVPALLRQHGYRTAAIGKWHLGLDADQEPVVPKDIRVGDGGLPVGAKIIDGPTTRGVDSYYGFSQSRTMGSLIENDRVIARVEPVSMLPRLTARATQCIAEQAQAKQPFFLYLALNSPHWPIVPSPEWVGKSGLGQYGDFVMETDWALGQVIEAVEKAGIAKNTLLIFTSDNGCSPEAGTDALEKRGHYASWILRGYKTDIWDGGHRIPFIAQWPGKIAPGSKSQRLTCLTDFMATCAALVGEKLPATGGEDSVNMLPALLGNETDSLREAIIHHSADGSFSIRQGQWKLELCPGSGGWGKPGNADARQQGLPAVQLYDMTADIRERTNVQAEYPDRVAKLTKLLKQYIADGRSTPGAPQKNDVKIDLWKTPGKHAGDD